MRYAFTTGPLCVEQFLVITCDFLLGHVSLICTVHSLPDILKPASIPCGLSITLYYWYRLTYALSSDAKSFHDGAQPDWLQWPPFESMGSVLIFATPRVGVQFFILLFFSVSLLLLTLPTKILPSEFLWEASTYTPKFKVNEEGQQAIFNHKFSKFPFFRSNDRPRNKLTDSAAWQAFYQRLRCLCSYLNPCKCLFSE